jgi:hypothetical protein
VVFHPQRWGYPLLIYFSGIFLLKGLDQWKKTRVSGPNVSSQATAMSRVIPVRNAGS